MAEKIEGEGGGCAGRDGREACGGRLLPSIFDGLPAGPLDMAALLHERMQRDTEARVLACLDRALARRGRAADSESTGEGQHGQA